MKSYKIIVPANQEMDDWFEFINDSLKHSSEVNNLIVDFNYVNFLHTDDFVVLACLIESYYIKGAKVSFIGGTVKFNNHLNNIKFKLYWEAGFNRENFTISLNRTTLCLWKLNRDMMYGYSMFAKKYFNDTFMSNKDLLPLSSNLDEVFNNIFDHSNSEISGYVITQYFPKINKLSFAVCDFGIGIPKSINNYRIKNNQKEIEDFRALLKSIELGYSVQSTPRNRGFGLNNILELTESSNGELIIVSNNGILQKRANENYEIGTTKHSFSGTLIKVEMDLSTFENIDDSDNLYGF